MRIRSGHLRMVQLTLDFLTAVPTKTKVFLPVYDAMEKKILASVIGIQKENW